MAFLRPEKNAPGLSFRLLHQEPLVVHMSAEHRLAQKTTIRPEDIDGETLVGVPGSDSPALRAIIDRYGKDAGIDLIPDHAAMNIATAVSLVASTGGVSLLPRYVRNMLPPAVVSRPIDGAAPTIDLVLGFNEANRSSLLESLLAASMI